MGTSIHCVWEKPCILGEGPIWHPLEKVLYWVDIVKPELHCLNPRNNFHQSWIMPTDICCVAPNKKGGLIAALKNGITILNPVSNNVRYIAELNKNKTMFNDGHCDRQGRFWIGTKDIAESNSNAGIFRLDNNKLIQQADNFIVSNGLISSLDSKYFYIADSPNRIIYRYDFNVDTGEIGKRIIFAKISDDSGYPDGMTIDSEGYLWGCHFNGWRVTRYDPDGKIDRVIKMPVSAPTSCCLGGADLKTLFITSAKRDVTNVELKNQPLAGGVFAIDVDVPGVNEPCFDGE
ncbi:MAG: SMP-30/gluconolactonase/LRE family protein [Gammaproteobacteria bacterium]|nr:SMP-30/gluconolactonase/LRE family protein [Gammaproteobacteria bacterium]